MFTQASKNMGYRAEGRGQNARFQPINTHSFPHRLLNLAQEISHITEGNK